MSAAPGSQAMLPLAGRDDAALVDLDVAGGLQLADDLLGVRVLGCHLVVVGQLLLGLGKARELGRGVLLLEESLLLVGLDLGLGASALRADLQHVGAGASLH